MFGAKERAVAVVLSRFPLVKKAVKILYSRLMYLCNRKNYKFQSQNKILSLGNEAKESFFGYYDKSPMSVDGYVLCHLSEVSTSVKALGVGCFFVALFKSDDLFNPIIKIPSLAYNWQQGSRLHWLNGDLFIFNDFDQNKLKYISRVYSKETLREIKNFDFPVQDSFGAEYFISINYRRILELCPDYGYCNLPPLSKEELKNLKNDGIWKVDYATGNSQLIYSLADVCAVDCKDGFERARHKVNHVMISPSGNNFIFLHRYYVGRRRFHRLMLADANGGSLKVLADYGMVSHCCWINEENIIAYLRGPEKKDAYYIININNGTFNHFAGGALDAYGDGHPHVKGDWFVTDTYPDKSRMQHLFLCNWKTGEIQKLGEFFHGFRFGGVTRCDLHPRISPCGKKVFFDSVYSGKRKLYMMELLTPIPV